MGHGTTPQELAWRVAGVRALVNAGQFDAVKEVLNGGHVKPHLVAPANRDVCRDVVEGLTLIAYTDAMLTCAGEVDPLGLTRALNHLETAEQFAQNQAPHSILGASVTLAEAQVHALFAQPEAAINRALAALKVFMEAKEFGVTAAVATLAGWITYSAQPARSFDVYTDVQAALKVLDPHAGDPLPPPTLRAYAMNAYLLAGITAAHSGRAPESTRALRLAGTSAINMWVQGKSAEAAVGQLLAMPANQRPSVPWTNLPVTPLLSLLR